jgi:phage tail-like protein
MAIKYNNSKFTVQFAGEDLNCSKVRNLAFNIEFTTTRIGEERSQSVENLLGNKVYEPVILERPIQKGNNSFFRLWQEGNKITINGNERVMEPMVIKLLDATADTVAVWTLANPQITKLSYSDFDAQGNAVLTEMLEVIYEGIGFEMG